MLKRISLVAFLCCLLAVSLTAQQLSHTNVKIDYSTGDLMFQDEAKGMLQLLLEDLTQSEQITKVEITAYADNRTVAEDRVAPILKFFKEQGITSEQMDVATQLDDHHKIEIVLTSTVGASASSEKPVDNHLTTAKPQKRYCAGQSQQAEVFTIEPYQNVDITAKQGTKIKINRSALMHQNGMPVVEPIKIELKEFYRSDAILLADLHTMEDDKVLETGGMLNLKITSRGKPLLLKKGRSAKVQLPTRYAKGKKGMNLYTGKVLASGAVNWNLERRNNQPEPVAETTGNYKEFDVNSYIKLKMVTVVDSVTHENKQYAKAKGVTQSTGYPVFKTQTTKHTHEEEYFDLELPYLTTQEAGNWMNVDRRTPTSGPRPIEVLVDVKGIPPQGVGIDGQEMTTSPRVAIMMKEQASFLRGEFLGKHPEMQEQAAIKFERVPRNQEAVLVAFLDTGKEFLFASKEIETTKDLGRQDLVLKPMPKQQFEGAVAALAN